MRNDEWGMMICKTWQLATINKQLSKNLFPWTEENR